MCQRSENSELDFLAEYIKTQRKRLGGNFVIARAIGSKKERDQIRSTLPDCIFIILSMTKEFQKKRLLARHGEDKSAEGVGNSNKNIFSNHQVVLWSFF